MVKRNNSALAQLFQFHKGTIKPEPDRTDKLLVKRLFQFHKGTIKPKNSTKVLIQYSHFNSINVRLNLGQHCRRTVVHTFQFHKGTIKPCLKPLSLSYDTLFQFHKGTIKPVILLLLLLHLLYFNSIKVRLNL